MTESSDNEIPQITELSKRGRRVAGVLVEKAFTTPEYYPLTLKATTTGCNQKSNRAPVSNFSEDEVEETLDELREMGLVTVVYTESGRAPRYRHWLRKCFTFTEPQLAILTELLLRGRQSMGELRARSSRLVPIESLADLRGEVAGLIEMRLVQASGPLDRRGVEVDHAMYPEKEGMAISAAPAAVATGQPSAPPTAAPAPRNMDNLQSRVEMLEQNCLDLRSRNQELCTDFAGLKEAILQLEQVVGELRADLGG